MTRKPAVRSGAFVPVLLMLPNVVRSVALALPFFDPLHLKRAWSMAVLGAMAGALAVYHLAWGRFFPGGGSTALLRAPLLAIPSPLALAPVALSSALVVPDELLVDVRRRPLFRSSSRVGIVPDGTMTACVLVPLDASAHVVGATP